MQQAMPLLVAPINLDLATLSILAAQDAATSPSSTRTNVETLICTPLKWLQCSSLVIGCLAEILSSLAGKEELSKIAYSW
jgi:hypothetical protein